MVEKALCSACPACERAVWPHIGVWSRIGSGGRGRRVGAKDAAVLAPRQRITAAMRSAAASWNRERTLLDGAFGQQSNRCFKAHVVDDLLVLLRADADTTAAYRTCRAALERSGIGESGVLSDLATLMVSSIALRDVDHTVDDRPPNSVAAVTGERASLENVAEGGAPNPSLSVEAASSTCVTTPAADVPPPVVGRQLPVRICPCRQSRRHRHSRLPAQWRQCRRRQMSMTTSPSVCAANVAGCSASDGAPQMCAARLLRVCRRSVCKVALAWSF